MHKALRISAALAVASLPVALAAAPADASSNASGGTTYQATLNPLNHASGSGMITITVNGTSADVKESWSGLAASFSGSPYPHVQHIHIGAAGTCPGPDADKNGDGVISTTEGGSAYGAIGTTLSTSGDSSPAAGTDLKVAPSGDSTQYSRTLTLDSQTLASLKGGTAVVVVHGLDPATLSKQAQGEKSDLVPSLPLAATSPALCGALSSMPSGGVATGSGSTAGVQDSGLLALGGGLLAAGVGFGAWTLRRRSLQA